MINCCKGVLQDAWVKVPACLDRDSMAYYVRKVVGTARQRHIVSLGPRTSPITQSFIGKPV